MNKCSVYNIYIMYDSPAIYFRELYTFTRVKKREKEKKNRSLKKKSAWDKRVKVRWVNSKSEGVYSGQEKLCKKRVVMSFYI